MLYSKMTTLATKHFKKSKKIVLLQFYNNTKKTNNNPLIFDFGAHKSYDKTKNRIKIRKKMEYKKFLENKIVSAESYGFEIDKNKTFSDLLPHQKDICHWAIQGGRRAIFASFGMGKTVMQLQIATSIIEKENKPFLICLPLGVVGEFKRDAKMIGVPYKVQYITETDTIQLDKNTIYLTNYERVRKGDIDSNQFAGVSFDEASAIRNLKTQTTDYILNHFQHTPYRFVFTATPTPNDFIEILNYASFLGVIDRGHALTRFFKRDSTKAGQLTLHETKKDEFWKWVSTWAVFLNKPSDLGYNDDGYDLPQMHIHEILLDNITDEVITNKNGDLVMFKDTTKSLLDTSREKRESIQLRVEKALEIVEQNPNDNYILWHHLESERQQIERTFKKYNLKSVYGSQPNAQKEDLLIDFSNGKYQILATKPKIAGSGCNFQHACNRAIFVGIDYKFNDFIQAVHRIYRFKQSKEVHIYILYTQNEQEVLKALKEKWRKHIELQTQMINIVRDYGLNNDKITTDMKRQIFEQERHHQVGNAKVWNQDCVIATDYLEDNSVDMILTSIPFGDHYEYSDNYNDFGHNDGNEEFFKQMDYLTPKLLQKLAPGRVAAIHVKDRIRYSHQNGTCFTTIDDFSGETVAHFKKHGFYLMGKITITTDVVRENNQTYRLTWGEQRKDATKMGVGLPEYVLLFRKAPTNSDNAYADTPVTKTPEEYPLAEWQLDAHAYWKSNGDRFLSSEELKTLDMKAVYNLWKQHDKEHIYSFQKHLETSQELDKSGRLSKLFMTLPPQSNSEYVWDDINRMNTLNTNQANRKKEQHICPLQHDVVRRLLNRYTSKGETVLDPFGGLFTTAYNALEMGRKAVSFELNPEYYDDGLFYLKSIEYKINTPTLFDLEEIS